MAKRPEQRPRLADSVETALKLGAGVVLVAIEGEEERLFSEHFACVYCGISLGEIAPRNFSFNSPTAPAAPAPAWASSWTSTRSSSSRTRT